MWIDSIIQADWAFAFAMSIILSIVKGILLFMVLFILEKSLFRNIAKAKYHLYITGLLLLAILFIRDIFSFALVQDGNSIMIIEPLENIFSGLTNLVLTVPESNPQVFQIISIAWTLGILFYGLKFSLNNWHLSQLRKNAFSIDVQWQKMVDQLQRRLGTNQKISILGSDQINVPIVMGILKPLIVIPFPLLQHFSPKELETILLHELIHIKRADFFIKHIQSIILCFMYFNPMAWLMSHKIDSYREFSCDDEVISISKAPKHYLKALYEVAKYSIPQKQRSIALFNHKSELIMRINRMLAPKPSKWGLRSMFPVVLSLLTLSSLFAFQINNDIQEEIEAPLTNILLQDVNLKSIAKEVMPVKEIRSVPIQAAIENVVEIQDPVTLISSQISSIVPQVQIAKIDTVPDQEKIKKLEKELEIKSREIEEISRKMEEAMESTVELDAAKLEKLAKELEAKIQPQLEKMELEMENSKAKKEMELLSKEFEMQYEAKMKNLELELDEEVMKAMELRMEDLGKKLDLEMQKGEGAMDQNVIEELKNQMQEESIKIQAEMKNFQKLHMDLQNDPQFKDMQAKMQALSQELVNQSQIQQQIWDEQSQSMKAEMQILQENIQKSMKEIDPQIQKDLQAKAMEIKKIAQELEKEKAKGKKKVKKSKEEKEKKE